MRIWNNYIENTMMTIANAATSIGPLYIWRNIGGRSYSPPGSEWNLTHGDFMKMGYADSEKWMTGHMYVFNNTVFQLKDQGPNGLGGESSAIKHCVSRNNILQARSSDTHSISTDKRSVDNDFDYDLLSGAIPRRPGEARHQGHPSIRPQRRVLLRNQDRQFQLSPDSPGYHKALVIPNFCERSTAPARTWGPRIRHPADGVRSQGPVHSAGRPLRKAPRAI